MKLSLDGSYSFEFLSLLVNCSVAHFRPSGGPILLFFLLWALYAVGCGELQCESSVQTKQSTGRTEEGSLNRSAAVCRIGLCLSNCNRSAALIVKLITYIISVHTHSLAPSAAGGCH